jgi:epoxyqueuosine reductase QueG
MTVENKILAKASELFDVCGATIQQDGRTLLIVGLESTAERNLDEFVHKSGNFIMLGFRTYAAPKLEALINFIHKKKFSAVLAGPYGYPLEGEINLKNEAIRAGLGKRGKNTLVLHPEFGHRLRFMGIYTSAVLTETLRSADINEKENATCRNCSICIDICPIKALEPYRMIKRDTCLSNVSPQTANGRSALCDKCVTYCPAGLKIKKITKAPKPTRKKTTTNTNNGS